jgi:predicted XRE-type DNA-binding protein
MPLPDPIPPLKVQVARAVTERLDGWSQINAGELLGSDQPRISNLRNGRLERFSLDQLIRFVARLNGTVTIQVTWPVRRWNFRTPARPHPGERNAPSRKPRNKTARIPG